MIIIFLNILICYIVITTSSTNLPTSKPSSSPSNIPTSRPSTSPTLKPTVAPSALPTSKPTVYPSTLPTSKPSSSPTCNPTKSPTSLPSSKPTSEPTCNPTKIPTALPSSKPTSEPTYRPTALPTQLKLPSFLPTLTPTVIPSLRPTSLPSTKPTSEPTEIPSKVPSDCPTIIPVTTLPTVNPSSLPSHYPSQNPSKKPTKKPSPFPSSQPTCYPTEDPTDEPSNDPTSEPSIIPTEYPSFNPSNLPTTSPSVNPSIEPTLLPTMFPTTNPSNSPSGYPTFFPTECPTTSPTNSPTSEPTYFPSSYPTTSPTTVPSILPTTLPTNFPSIFPSTTPTSLPSTSPSFLPSNIPSVVPTLNPSKSTTSNPTKPAPPPPPPTNIPSSSPTFQPSSNPTISFSPTITFSPTAKPVTSAPSSTNAPTDGPKGIPPVSFTFSGQSLLYDLSVDPYESNNVFNTSGYVSSSAYFTSRKQFWSKLAKSQLAFQVGVQPYTSIFLARGGLGPYLNTTFVPTTITQKYSYKAAPNIVFLLVDDWGYNDIGYKSTYLNWTTPTIDKLGSEGVKLSNYYTYHVCSPTRAAFMTGRYTVRYGFQTIGPELPLNETTLAQELKSAGYINYLVGKWHLGFSTKMHIPNSRGFDNFYGFLSGDEDYYTKKVAENFDMYDVQANKSISKVDSSIYNAYLWETKAEEMLKNHSIYYPTTPFFMFYSSQLIHWPWEAPSTYLARCQTVPSTIANYALLRKYCAMNVMLDEMVANFTCALKKYGFDNNTILIISGDNGGDLTFSGNSYPFKGGKSYLFRGGVSNNAIIHSTLLPKEVRGSTYSGLVHITDWLPTFMGLATNNAWKGSYTNATLDGADQWNAIITNSTSQRSEIVHYTTNVGTNTFSALQLGNLKYYYGFTVPSATVPPFQFTKDQNISASRKTCSNPYLEY